MVRKSDPPPFEERDSNGSNATGASEIPAILRALPVLVVVFLVAGLVGSALSPVLLVKHPLLLIALSPDNRHLALVVGSVDPLPLVSLAVVRRTIFSVLMFGVGIMYGDTAVAWLEARYPRVGRLIRYLERVFGRFGAALLVPLPFGSVCVLAGAARARFASFLPAVILGHGLWVGSVYVVGGLISDSTARFKAFLSANLLESTLVCVAAVLAQQWLSRSRVKRSSP